MLDLLIHTTDSTYLNRDLKSFDDAYDRASCMKQGYLQTYRPTGWKWGTHELDRKRFIIVRIQDHQFNPIWLEMEYDRDGNELCDRKYRFPLAKLLSTGELESLRNITYNSTEKLSPIIKTVDLKTVVEINDWEKQPTPLKLHGSAGDFDVQESGGDYTSLQTAIETEASNISGGSTDANFYISGSWTSAESGHFDVDGWTMGSNNMLIQTTGDARHSDGVWNSTGWRYTVGDAYGMDIETPNCTVDGLQVVSTGTNDLTGLIFASASGTTNVTIKNCVMDGGGYVTPLIGTDSNLDSSDVINIFSNVLYKASWDGSGEGIYIKSGTCNIWNNTIVNMDDGIEVSGGTNSIANNAIITIHTDNIELDGGTNTTNYNASDDGSGTNGVTTSQSEAQLFNAPTSDDYSLVGTTSDLYDSGTSATRPTTDITGYEWTTNDIGAFAWQTAGGDSLLPNMFHHYNKNIGSR